MHGETCLTNTGALPLNVPKNPHGNWSIKCYRPYFDLDLGLSEAKYNFSLQYIKNNKYTYVYIIYQVNLKPHKQQQKNSSRKMMWQHRASKITHGQVRMFRLKHYLKIYYIYNSTSSNGCRSRN